MTVVLFYSPYCDDCGRARELMRRAPAGWRACNVLVSLEEAVTLGVRRTPTLVVDDRVQAVGPDVARELERLLATAAEGPT